MEIYEYETGKHNVLEGPNTFDPGTSSDRLRKIDKESRTKLSKVPQTQYSVLVLRTIVHMQFSSAQASNLVIVSYPVPHV